MTAWRKLSRFEGRSSFRSWVSGIGFRIARDAKRAHGRAQVRESDWQSEQGNVEAGAPLSLFEPARASLHEAFVALVGDKAAITAAE